MASNKETFKMTKKLSKLYDIEDMSMEDKKDLYENPITTREKIEYCNPSIIETPRKNEGYPELKQLRERLRENRRKKRVATAIERQKVKNEEGLSTKNASGYSDYTPFNALTGNEYISTGKVIDPKAKVPGGFNTSKK